MEKKIWSNPELKQAEIYKTDEVECSCGIVQSIERTASKHPCHKTGNGEHNDSGNHVAGVEQNGHVLSNGCTNRSHYDANGNPICCCYKPSQS